MRDPGNGVGAGSPMCSVAMCAATLVAAAWRAALAVMSGRFGLIGERGRCRAAGAGA